jgi:hypothetical protein
LLVLGRRFAARGGVETNETFVEYWWKFVAECDFIKANPDLNKKG